MGLFEEDSYAKCHDTRWAGHPGVQRTQALIERGYYWPRMGDDIQLFVKTCLVCQQDKAEQRRPAGLLEPLPTPSEHLHGFHSGIAEGGRPWQHHGCGRPTQGIVKYWRLQRDIVSDRDARFTGRFWTELFRLMGTDLRFSTSFHPQTDGQTERVNALLELYLRHFVSAN
ncbi:hypothetical protein GH714_020951 [Hevea brasiliensis]|uniref:Integrase catalytic domain-containing protein n=1 Tax=Hevea brasiliensis TaxID=3981 RepID=A0A6A6MJN8_HEVBR|nr:hypothetical protein GH714_020951 [Hevea brasiliensis]